MPTQPASRISELLPHRWDTSQPGRSKLMLDHEGAIAVAEKELASVEDRIRPAKSS